MSTLADIHCHILPYVDDGAATLNTALELLEQEAAQGVGTVCLTPHLRQDMFETPDEVVRQQFLRLRERAKDLPVALFLSREYHCDRLFWKKLEDGALMTLGSRTVLLEFSSRHPFSYLRNAVQQLRQTGLSALIAHVERYPVLREDPNRVALLRDMGALIQCNASCILGREGLRGKWFCHGLLKRHLVDVAASDAHDPAIRTPELGACGAYLVKRYGREYGQSLVSDTPLALLK